MSYAVIGIGAGLVIAGLGMLHPGLGWTGFGLFMIALALWKE